MGKPPAQPALTFSLWTHTMNRCKTGCIPPATAANSQTLACSPALSAFVSVAVAALGLTCGAAMAQTGPASNASASALARMNTPMQRTFPAKAMRASMTVLNAHEVALNGTPRRLSPGSIIRTTTNAIVVSGGLVGQTFVVNYTTDTMGQAHEIWILTAHEATERRAGSDGMAPPNATTGER